MSKQQQHKNANKAKKWFATVLAAAAAVAALSLSGQSTDAGDTLSAGVTLPTAFSFDTGWG